MKWKSLISDQQKFLIAYQRSFQPVPTKKVKLICGRDCHPSHTRIKKNSAQTITAHELVNAPPRERLMIDFTRPNYPAKWLAHCGHHSLIWAALPPRPQKWIKEEIPFGA